MCARALLDDTTGSVLRLLLPAIAPEAQISLIAPRNHKPPHNPLYSRDFGTPAATVLSGVDVFGKVEDIDNK